MQLKREELLHALNTIKPGLAIKSVIAQMENATFTGEDLIAYNDQICVLFPFKTDFEASVKFDDLYKIVSKIPTEDLALNVVANELQITTESTKAGLNLSMEDEIANSVQSIIDQLPNAENGLTWQELFPEFREGALLCIPAAESDTSKGVLACLYANNNDLICSDNKRVSWFELKNSLNSEFFIKATTVKEFAQFDFTSFCVSESWINFRMDNGAIFSTKLIRGKGLDYFKKVFEGFDEKEIELPENLREIIDAASVMADDKDEKRMRIEFRGDEVVCSTRSVRGWIEKITKVNYKDKTPVEFRVDAKLLQQLVGQQMTMRLGKNKSLFSNGQFKHVLIHLIGD